MQLFAMVSFYLFLFFYFATAHFLPTEKGKTPSRKCIRDIWTHLIYHLLFASAQKVTEIFTAIQNMY